MAICKPQVIPATHWESPPWGMCLPGNARVTFPHFSCVDSLFATQKIDPGYHGASIRHGANAEDDNGFEAMKTAILKIGARGLQRYLLMAVSLVAGLVTCLVAL